MSHKRDIEAVLKAHKNEWVSTYHLSSMGIFGSYARGEQTKVSDVDILVEFEKPIGLLKFVHFKDQLSGLLGMPVDLVMKSALKPGMKDRILSETQYL